MRIEDSVKLDYNDVLLKPKRSTLKSRNEVDLERTFKIEVDDEYTCIPIIAANMDTTGTMEMAKAFHRDKLNVALHKHYTVDQLYEFFRYGYPSEYSWYTMGITQDDYNKYQRVKERCAGKYNWNVKICIDVANGYTERFLDYVKKVRDENPCAIIMAGNVVTAEMTEALILAGANVVKVGIGSGCFLPGQKVRTNNGLKAIENINIGEIVLTHKGNWQQVTNKFTYEKNEKMLNINGIKCTKNHEFYVLKKKYKDIVTDETLHEYAEWIPAEKLNKTEYFLLKHK
jgi:IMP dehydrogenase / GMP reductase domain